MRYEFLNRKAMTAKEYREVVEIIKNVLQTETKENVSFLLYGSLLDNRLMPGISDIDCVLFFWNDFVLEPKIVKQLSESFRHAFSFTRFDLGWFLDVSVIDAGNARDGRFIPQNDNFSKIFEPQNGDSKLLLGKSFVEEMSPVRLVDPVEARLAFNLEGLRRYLLFGRCNNKWINGVNPFRELKIFQQIRSLGRKTMQLVEPDNMEILKDKKKAFIALKNQFLEINFDALDEIEKMFKNREIIVDTIVSAETFEMLLGALTCYEKVIRKIVKTMTPKSVKGKG